MSKEIDKYISEKKIVEALVQCLNEKQYEFGQLLGNIWIENNGNCESDVEILKIKDIIRSLKDASFEDLPELESKIRVLCSCSWKTSTELCKYLDKMSKGNCCWNDIEVVSEEPADFRVILNAPYNLDTDIVDGSKTILFRMEPYMEKNPAWKKWSNPDKKQFLFAGFHEEHYNNLEWHLSLTYNQLMSFDIVKNELFNVSTIISNKYGDVGQKKRVDFLKFLDAKEDISIHVFGRTQENWKEYKGALPEGEKDNGLLPYKYTFNGENNVIPNYFTEKLIDGILSECLTVYFGCPNVSDYIDERAYVKIELEDFEHDYNIIKKMIREDWWSERIDIIRKEKQKILNELQFFPRIEKIIQQK